MSIGINLNDEDDEDIGPLSHWKEDFDDEPFNEEQEEAEKEEFFRPADPSILEGLWEPIANLKTEEDESETT